MIVFVLFIHCAELGVGMGAEAPLRAAGSNMVILHESAVVEACNLKFAIDYRMKHSKLLKKWTFSTY